MNESGDNWQAILKKLNRIRKVKHYSWAFRSSKLKENRSSDQCEGNDFGIKIWYIHSGVNIRDGEESFGLDPYVVTIEDLFEHIV